MTVKVRRYARRRVQPSQKSPVFRENPKFYRTGDDLQGGDVKGIVIFADKSRALVKGGEEAVNEAVVDTIDDLLEWNLVPPTVGRVSEIPDFTGNWPFMKGSPVSFQEWKKGAKPLDKFRPSTTSEESTDTDRSAAFDLDDLDDDLDILHWVTSKHPNNRLRLLQMAVLDVLINNVDRHLGNILIDRQGKIWAIDHGLAFFGSFGSNSGAEKPVRQYFKNETDRIPNSILNDLRNLEEGDLRAALSPLPRNTIDSTIRRWKGMMTTGRIT
jgi:hypothetical protein